MASPTIANAAVTETGGSGTPNTGTRGPDFCAANPEGPRALVFTYEGSTCTGNCNSDAPGEVIVTGDTAGRDTVYIVALDALSPKTVLFSGTVSFASKEANPNSAYFVLDLTGTGRGPVGLVMVNIYDKKGGAVRSKVIFPTSCAQPLHQGDYFGSLRLSDFEP